MPVKLDNQATMRELRKSCSCRDYRGSLLVARDLESLDFTLQGLLGGSGGVAVSDITLENYRDMFERNTGVFHVAMDFFIFHARLQ